MSLRPIATVRDGSEFSRGFKRSSRREKPSIPADDIDAPPRGSRQCGMKDFLRAAFASSVAAGSRITVAAMLLTIVAAAIHVPAHFSAYAQSTPQPAPTQTAPTQAAPTQKGTPMSAHAIGPFEVKLVPQEDPSGDPARGRMTI